LLWFGDCFGELAEEVEGVVAYAAVGFKEYGDYGVGGVLAAFVLFLFLFLFLFLPSDSGSCSCSCSCSLRFLFRSSILRLVVVYY
jgi:hypothetical protein